MQLAVATTTVVRQASYSLSTQPHCEDRSKEPSGSRCRHALGSQLNKHEGNAQRRINANAKTCKCE
eukprot:1999557-Pleurochrysis_carterae.AAC.1